MARLTQSQIDAARKIMKEYNIHIEKHGLPSESMTEFGKPSENKVWISVKQLNKLTGRT